MKPRPPAIRRLVNVSLFFLSSAVSIPVSSGEVTTAQVERSIRRGVDFLISQQRPTGEWPGQTGASALATLALLTAGRGPEDPATARALAFLTRSTELNGHETYTIALKTMAFAAADPTKYRRFIEVYARRLQATQFARVGRNEQGGGGGWSYGAGGSPDNSNTQYALLGLQAASDAGVVIPPKVWNAARRYWLDGQNRDGGWGYKPDLPSYGSMTCAGISSLVITGARRMQSRERLVGDEIHDCGSEGADVELARAIDWMGSLFSVRVNPRHEGMYKLYYLYGLERAGRLAGIRWFGRHDWYREGAEELVRTQDPVRGSWQGDGGEHDPVLATSFALLFLAKGRTPVLINEFRHGPGRDWNNDPDDVANLAAAVSRDWKSLVTWQTVDPAVVPVEELLTAPIGFISGHLAPEFSAAAKQRIREFTDQGGFLLADACCSRREFDEGFRALMKELYPESELRPLGPDHPIRRARHDLSGDEHPLFGIEQGCRTVVVYSPADLSCYWHHAESEPAHPRVVAAISLGQNIVDYATGRELPADKLAEHRIAHREADLPKRGALRIAKLRHAGAWNVAPMAVPNLTTTLRDKLQFDVVINHREIRAEDPNLVHYPLVYFHGRAGFVFSEEEVRALRRHLDPGGGTLLIDAACGSESFDRDVRKLAAALFPDRSLTPIPGDDALLSRATGFDLSDCRTTRAAGGTTGSPKLEGIEIAGRWALIYSPLDIGCALENHQSLDCRGFVPESALRIATNVVIYSTLP
ncbi:MAG: DUF4159 domain-containing protein [Isosphaeraceae bacterium]|nr:DUF4159 domain-containing protein [Isosphaeraceae bacterium]